MKTRKEDNWVVLGWSLALFLPIALYRAWIFSFLWVWFITPLVGMAVPSLWLLAGLLATTAYVIGVGHDSDKNEYPWTEVVGRMVNSGLVYPSFAFAFAWVIALLGGLL